MTDKEFRAYVYEEKRRGRSESQIARSLGMSLSHLMGKLNGVDVDKVDPPKTKKETPKPEKKPDVKPVSGAKQPEEHEKAKNEAKEEKPVDIPKAESVEESKEEVKTEDFSWME